MGDASTSWVQQLFGGVDKLTDVLNMGRLVFYTAAGILVVYPLAAVGKLVTQGPCALHGQPIHELVAAQPALDAWMLFGSVVAGFVVASIGFVTVVQREQRSLSAREPAPGERKPGFPYHYPWLRNSDTEDFSAWIIQEYFRFVEIVAYVPLALLIGLAEVTLFAMVYMLHWVSFGKTHFPSAAHRDFVVLAVALIIARQAWKLWWVPRVVGPVIQSYVDAKNDVIVGLEKWRGEKAEAKKAEAQQAEAQKVEAKKAEAQKATTQSSRAGGTT